jgi:nicotinic acid mononucleotide adenylyltransferase
MTLGSLFRKVPSKKFQIFEMGCGAPVADFMMSQAGASNYIDSSFCLYSKKAQRDYLANFRNFKNERIRSVSLESVRAFLDAPTDEHNIIISTVSASKDKDLHGYVGLRFEGSIICVHFTQGISTNHDTITKHNARGMSLKCVELLIAIVTDNKYRRDELYEEIGSYIDGIFTGISLAFEPTLLPNNHFPFVYYKYKWRRLLEFVRISETISIVRGSFNPYHQGHDELVTATDKVNVMLSMSTTTFDGKVASLNDLISRAEKVDIPVIMDSSTTTYLSLINVIKKLNYNFKKIYFPMGVDVYSKLDIRTLPDNVELIVKFRAMNVDRVSFRLSKYPTLSSTKIRKENEIN